MAEEVGSRGTYFTTFGAKIKRKAPPLFAFLRHLRGHTIIDKRKAYSEPTLESHGF